MSNRTSIRFSGHVRKALYRTPQRNWSRRLINDKRNDAIAMSCAELLARAISKTVDAHALLPETVEIYVGFDERGVCGKALRLG